MKHVRPYEFFALLKAPPASRVSHVAIPHRRARGGLTLLETFVLVSAQRTVDARRIFEFGTFRGTTTYNLALNCPPDAEVFTLDLDLETTRGIAQDAADAPITAMHFEAEHNFDFTGSAVANMIKPLLGDSKTFDFTPWKNSIDLVFIDGGHDLETLAADTEHALSMARQDRPSCILWHDYRNADYAPLTQFLDDLSATIEITHIEDTMLCAHFCGTPGAI